MNMSKIILTPLETIVDDVWGKKGMPKHEAMEKRLKEDIDKSHCGNESIDYR